MIAALDISVTEVARAFLSDRLKAVYGSRCEVEAVDPLPYRSPSRHPVYAIRLRGAGAITRADLHFRQSLATAANEIRALGHARALGVRVPEVVLSETGTDHPLGAPFILREYVEGAVLWAAPDLLAERWRVLIDTLLLLHSPRDESVGPPPLSRLFAYQRMSASLERASRSDHAVLGQRLDQLIRFASRALEELRVPRVCELNNELHRYGVLWIDTGELCIVNWERTCSGDPCADFALVRMAVEDAGASGIERLQGSLLEAYQDRYGAEPLHIRLAYHIAERYLALVARSCSPVLVLNAARRYLARLNAFCATPIGATLFQC